MRKFFLNNTIAFILALVVGVIIFLPTILSIKEIGFENFKGLYPIFNKDEIHYLAMSKEAEDGHNLGNPFIKEYKDVPYLQPSFTSNIFLLESTILQKSIPFVYALNDFLLPFIGYLVLYYLFLLITKSKIKSNIFSLLFFLMFLNTFGRPVSLQLNGIFLFLGLIIIWKIFSQKEKNSKLIILNILLGIVTGLLVYMYPYYWTALVVLYGLVVMMFLFFSRNIRYLLYSINFFIAFILMIIPYIINNLKAINNPFYTETISRFGLLNNHWPACYTNVAFVAIALFLFLIFKNNIKDKKDLYIGFSLLIGAIIFNWQNVITGKYLQFSSHYYPVTLLFIVLSVAILSKYIQEARMRNMYKQIMYLLVALALIVIIGNRQKSEIYNKFNYHKLSQNECGNNSQNLVELFNWTKKNTEPDSSLYTIGYDNTYFTIYSHNNVFFNSYTGYYLMSDEEIEERWIVQNYFSDINYDLIKSKSRVLWKNKFIDNYQNKSIRNQLLSKIGVVERKDYEMVSQEYIDRVLKRSIEIKKNDLVSLLRDYEEEFVVVNNCGNKYNKELDYFNNSEFTQLIKKIDNNYIFIIR